MGRDPKPSAHSRRAARAAVPSDGLINEAVASQLEAARAEIGDKALCRLLLPFLLRDDGWLRIIPQDDGETVYWKWKYTGGKHVNHYVMVVYSALDSADALVSLARKIHAVDSGEKSPVKDHYFKG